MKRKILTLSLLAAGLTVSLLFTACSEHKPGATGEATLTKTETSTLQDGSTLLTKSYSDGSKIEERTFPSGPLTKARRVIKADGSTKAYITHRDDNIEVEISHLPITERFLIATGDVLSAGIRGVKAVGTEIKEDAQKVEAAVEKGAEKIEKEAEREAKGAKEGGQILKDKVKKAAEN